MSNWRAVLFPFRQLDVTLSRNKRKRYQHGLTEQELFDATESFRALPSLVAELTGNLIEITAEIRDPGMPLSSLSPNGKGMYWPSPDDIRSVLDQFAPRGEYDSVFVFWPQHDSRKGSSIPCRGWGLGMGPSDWSNGATYAVVANAPTSAWRGEAPGEVWLHEWLHGVCHFFQSRGYTMPDRDADGAEIHGYTRSPDRGWTEYYQDLLSGAVLENGQSTGIPTAALASAQPRLAGAA